MGDYKPPIIIYREKKGSSFGDSVVAFCVILVIVGYIVLTIMKTVYEFALGLIACAIYIPLILPYRRNKYTALIQSFGAFHIMYYMHSSFPILWIVTLLVPFFHLKPAVQNKNYIYIYMYFGMILINLLPVFFPALKPYFLFL